MFSASAIGIMTAAALCAPNNSFNVNSINALNTMNNNNCILSSSNNMQNIVGNLDIQSIVNDMRSQGSNCIVIGSNGSNSFNIPGFSIPGFNSPSTNCPPFTVSPVSPSTDCPPDTYCPTEPSTDCPPDTYCPSEPSTDCPPNTVCPTEPSTDCPPDTYCPTEPSTDCPADIVCPEPTTPAVPEETTVPETTVPEETTAPDKNNVSDNTVQVKPTTPAETPSVTQTVAEQVVALVNQERAKEGLAPLTLNRVLSNAAQIRANEIVTSFAHNRPDGSYFSTVLGQNNIAYNTAGENIAWGQQTAAIVVDAWMNSPGHRANIMNNGYTQIGIGYQVVNGTPYWAQLFTN